MASVPKFTLVGSERKRNMDRVLDGTLSVIREVSTGKPKMVQYSQPTPSQINRQDAAMIQSGVPRPSVDQQHRDHFAQTHPEYTGGMEGARTRQANTAVVQAQSQLDKAQTKVDDAQQKWNEVKLETPSAPASSYLSGGAPTTPGLSYAAGLQAREQWTRAEEWRQDRERTALEAELREAKGALFDAEKNLGQAQDQRTELDRERELLADVSTPQWDQRIREQYATTDQYGRVSDEEVRSQKIKAKKGMVQAERDKVQAEMDAAQDILFAEQDNAGDYWDPTHPSKRYADAWRDYQAAKERLDELDSELNELSNLDYSTRNESAFRRMAADPQASERYVSATKVKEDQKKLNEVIGYYQKGGGSREEYEHIAQLEADLLRDYGLGLDAINAFVNGDDTPRSGEVSVRQVMDTMAALAEGHRNALESRDGGYDLEDLYGYEQRLQSQQEAAQRAEKTVQYAREHPVLSAAGTIAGTLVQPLDMVNFDPGKGKPGDVGYIPPDTSDMRLTNAIQTVRGTHARDLERNTDAEFMGQNVAAFLYNTGMSMADSALAISTLGTGSVYLMGTNAAVNTAKEVVDSGGTTDQALKLGLAAGVAEVLFEKVSVENLLKPKTARGWRDVLTKVVLTQGGIELSEEALTETANILAEVSILGQSSEYAKAVKKYQEAGDSEDQAKQKAFLDMAGRVGWAGAGGFLSGIGMGGGKAAVDYAGQLYNNAYAAQKTASTGETELFTEQQSRDIIKIKGLEKTLQENAELDTAHIVERAKAGEVHSGVYRDAFSKSERQLRKSIASRVAQVEKHLKKIQTPELHDTGWATKSKTQKEGLLRKWRKDMQRNAEQAAIEIDAWKERFEK